MNQNETELNMRVQSAIEAPKLRRNIRGQVRAALACFPLGVQKRLACDFAEHGLRMILSSDPEKLEISMNGIRTIREFLNGETIIQRVEEVNWQAIQLDTIEVSHDYGSSLTTRRAGSIQMDLELCCCQRELVIAKLVIAPKKSPHNAFSVAKEVCIAIAHHVGGSDWDSPVPIKQKAARDSGHQASEDEAIWQRERLLKYALFETATTSARKRKFQDHLENCEL